MKYSRHLTVKHLVQCFMSQHNLHYSRFVRHALLSVLSICIFGSAFCHAVQITAEANGSDTPATSADQSAVIQNGDFQIFRTNPLPVGNSGFLMGDGINEFTRWTLDFTQDPNFALFDLSFPITSADLFLKLIPKDPEFITDFVRINSQPFINIASAVPAFTIGTPIDIHVNLLLFYSSDIIRNLLMTGAGLISMRYEDDAILTQAKLTLSNDIPEPGTYLLLFVGGLSLILFNNTRSGRIIDL